MLLALWICESWEEFTLKPVFLHLNLLPVNLHDIDGVLDDMTDYGNSKAGDR